jgi:hypothetical protein
MKSEQPYFVAWTFHDPEWDVEFQYWFSTLVELVDLVSPDDFVVSAIICCDIAIRAFIIPFSVEHDESGGSASAFMVLPSSLHSDSIWKNSEEWDNGNTVHWLLQFENSKSLEFEISKLFLVEDNDNEASWDGEIDEDRWEEDINISIGAKGVTWSDNRHNDVVELLLRPLYCIFFIDLVTTGIVRNVIYWSVKRTEVIWTTPKWISKLNIS